MAQSLQETNLACDDKLITLGTVTDIFQVGDCLSCSRHHLLRIYWHGIIHNFMLHQGIDFMAKVLECAHGQVVHGLNSYRITQKLPK